MDAAERDQLRTTIEAERARVVEQIAGTGWYRRELRRQRGVQCE
jgi:hypothetical protein